MSIFPSRKDHGKRCFTYCGDDRCNCEAQPSLLEKFRRQQAEDIRRSRKITDAGGIDGAVRRSDRIGP